MLLKYNKPIGFGLAIVLAIEYETGRAFERGMSDLEKFGVLLGGAEMIRVLERDGFSMKNLIGLGCYHNLSPKAQNKLLMALGTKAAAQRGLSLRKVMKLAAFRALEQNVRKVAVKAYTGYRFLKKGDFSLLTKMLMASGFDEYTRTQFAKYYAAKEYFETKGVLADPETEIAKEKIASPRPPVPPPEIVRDISTSDDYSSNMTDKTPILTAKKKVMSPIIKYGGGFILVCLALVLWGTLTSSPPEDRVLHAVATETTWLRIKNNGKIVYEGTLSPGQEISVKGRRSFRVWSGNAAGVGFKLDDEQLAPLGRSGEVVENYIVK